MNSENLNGYDFTVDPAIPRPRAVIEHCRECRGGMNPSTCDNDTCELYPHRNRKAGEGSRMAAVKRYCIGCQGGTLGKKQSCHITDCHLWPYRMGSPKASGGIMPIGSKLNNRDSDE